MEEKIILDSLKNKIKNNEEITSDEIIDFKNRLKGSFENNDWLLFLLLLILDFKPIEKEDDK